MLKPFHKSALQYVQLLCVIVCGVLCANVLSGNVYAASPEAGTRISNQAYATYFSIAEGTYARINSNTVNATVAPVESMQLSHDQTQYFSIAAFVHFNHQLRNTGNVTSQYSINLNNLNGDRFDLPNLELYYDINDDGQIDPNDILINNGDIITLQAGENASLLIRSKIPTSVNNGDAAQVELSVRSISQGVVLSNTDTAFVDEGALVRLNKKVSDPHAIPGDELRYTIDATNVSSTIAAGIPFAIDGSSQDFVLIFDEVPLNTSFVSSSTSIGTLMYQLSGSAENEYSTVLPADLSQITRVAAAIDQLLPSQSFTLEMVVRVNDNASGLSPNTAQIAYDINGDNAAVETNVLNSNTVLVEHLGAEPTLDFLDSTFSQPLSVMSVGSDLFIQADAAACNADSERVEIRRIIITSANTGDSEVLLGVETGVNTGMFNTQPFPTVQVDSGVVRGNGVLELSTDDSLNASFSECGLSVQTEILIDPAGVVFDSRNGDLIEGATVSLIDVTGAGNGGNAGGPALVFLADGVTPAPTTIVTGADGRYEFPLVRPSIYQITVTPPGVDEYTFASQVVPDVLPPQFVINNTGSYGQSFEVSVRTGAVFFDIPVDRVIPVGALSISKNASKDVVEVGDFVDYSITVRNETNQFLPNLTVIDKMPAGFTYVEGSLRYEDGYAREEALLTDPVQQAGNTLSVFLGALYNNTEVRFTYRLRVKHLALSGDGINSAQAFSEIIGSLRAESFIATAKVRVQAGVFSDDAYVIGKVYLDCRNTSNEFSDTLDLGVPGVRLFLEDGSSVITDLEGKFSFYGVKPFSHVLKVDKITLPAGAVLQETGVRNAGDAGSLFVDPKKGELHKANFAIACDSLEVFHAVEARREHAEVYVAELQKSVEETFRPEALVNNIDARSREATGYKDRANTNFSGLELEKVNPYLYEKDSDTTVVESASYDFSNELPKHNNSIGFLDLQDGDVLANTVNNVRVKGQIGAKFRLRLNGEFIPPSQIGQMAELKSNQLQALEYVGVEFLPGLNTLNIEQLDNFGGKRGSAEISVIAPDLFAKFALNIMNEPVADGVTPLKLQIELNDRDGVRVTSRTPVTVENELGRWITEDLNPDEPGLQIFVSGGVAYLEMLPPAAPAQGTIRLSSGIIEHDETINFKPYLRPLIASGIVEGAFSFRDLDTSKLTPARDNDGFEKELRSLSKSSTDGRNIKTGRAALFLKGKVRGDYLLTIAYDSEKDENERLFRDIQPDQFYPIYGDSSVRGFDAQSTGRLYVRVDKGQSFALLGDFRTQERDEIRQLSRYTRSLNGVKLHHENSRLEVNAYSSRDSNTQLVNEIPAAGVSGPYYLESHFIRPNSERIELVTRDRNQRNYVLNVVPLTRFTDYSLDPYTGALTFKSPVASLDRDLNPVFIRASYEVEEGGDEYQISGIDGRVKVFNNLQVGAAYIDDKNPLDPNTIRSVNAALKLGSKTLLSAEVAQSDKDGNTGDASRIELKHQGKRLDARVYATDTEEFFDNRNALMNKGRSEAGIKASFRANNNTTVNLDLIHNEDTQFNTRQVGGSLSVRQQIARNSNIEVGLKHNESTNISDPINTPTEETDTVWTKVATQVPYLTNLNVFAEYEQDVEDSNKKSVALGGDYQLANKGRVYARHELISSLGNTFSLSGQQQQNATVFGINSEYMQGGNLFSEYRVRDAISGRDAEAALGLRNAWTIRDGLRVSSSFEKVDSLDDIVERERLALTGAIEYTAADWFKSSTRLEFRNGHENDSLLGSVSAAIKLNSDLSLLGKFASLNDSFIDRGDKVQNRAQIGLAWRDTDTDVLNLLSRYEFRREKDDSLLEMNSSRDAHIFSLHANYQPREDGGIFSGRYASKWVDEDANGFVSNYRAQLLSGRYTRDLNRSWDISLTGSTRFEDDFVSNQYGLGIEVGHVLSKNLWLSAGYNVFGYKDEELVGEDYTAEGLFMRFRYKFDEDLFKK